MQTVLTPVLCFLVAGVLEAGAHVTCQVNFSAGVQPQILQGEVFCHVRVADKAFESGLSDLQQQQHKKQGAAGSLDRDQTVTTECEEEIIALHPLRYIQQLDQNAGGSPPW